MARPDFSEIPLIDIAALRAGGRDGVDEVAARIVEACETAGFFYVAGHGVSELDDRRNLRRRRLVLRRSANPPRRARRQDLAELPRLRADGHRRPDEAAPDARSVPDDARSPTRRPRCARRQRHGRPEPLARRRGSLSRRDGGLFRRDDGADGPFALGLRSRAWPAGRVLFRPFPETPNSTASPALPAAAPRFQTPRASRRIPTPARSLSFCRTTSAVSRSGLGPAIGSPLSPFPAPSSSTSPT